MISLSDQLADARWILEQRRKRYPDHVKDGKMSKETAEARIATARAIVQTLERAKMCEEMSQEMEARAEQSRRRKEEGANA